MLFLLVASVQIGVTIMFCIVRLLSALSSTSTSEPFWSRLDQALAAPILAVLLAGVWLLLPIARCARSPGEIFPLSCCVTGVRRRV